MKKAQKKHVKVHKPIDNKLVVYAASEIKYMADTAVRRLRSLCGNDEGPADQAVGVINFLQRENEKLRAMLEKKQKEAVASWTGRYSP